MHLQLRSQEEAGITEKDKISLHMHMHGRLHSEICGLATEQIGRAGGLVRIEEP